MHNIGKIAASQQQWLDWLRGQLPGELSPHLVQVVVRGGELIAYADSAPWSERLRYATEPLIDKVRERDATVSRIRLKVSPGGRAVTGEG